MHSSRDNIDAGGTISFGPDVTDLFRRAADLSIRSCAELSPSDLPVEQPTKFELVINLRSTKAMGLEVSLALLSHADEVVE